MTLFWFLGAALAVGVLAWVVRPLLSTRATGPVSRAGANISVYRDQLRELEADLAAGTLAPADYDRARAELEARLLEDVTQPENALAPPAGRKTALVVAAAVPILAFGLYLVAGDPAAINRQADTHASGAQIEAMVARLAARLRENPDDVDGWKLLGRSYIVMGRYDLSADAYAKAAARAPRDAQLLADSADALAMARGRRFDGEPEKLVQRALGIDPDNLKALALAGTIAFERRDYAAAVAHWQRMLPHVPPDSEDARAIHANVEEARSLAATGKQETRPEARPQARPQARQAVLRGTVRIAPQLREKVAPDDTLFIFARAAEGPPMPLAVLRKTARELPVSFSLDDSMAMTPAMKLSAFQRVVVSARISKSGNAAPQPGDLQGSSGPVANDSSAVTVLIDTVVR
jgi:cytochrome c-type biogenesis protein CcmH